MRFVTLDVFRGMTVFLMIVVNTPGSGATPFAPLLHAEWHGCTLTDLVFPAFLFAIGSAISFSSRRKSLAEVIRRGFMILTIGFLLSWLTTIYISNDWSVSIAHFRHLRFMGVLQRIGIAYSIAAMLALYLKDKQLIGVSVILLVGYWLLLKAGGNTGQEYSVGGNVVRRLDLLLLGENHMYRENGMAFDPEGLLSTVPAVASVIAGYLSGKLIQRNGNTESCAAILLIIGNLLIVTGLLWSFEMPLNKKLWTSSFVVYTSGIFLSVLGVLFFFYELKGKKAMKQFFTVFGANALFIYILSNLLGIVMQLPTPHSGSIYEMVNMSIYQAILPGPVGSLLFALSFTLLCWFAGYVLYKRKIFIRV